MFILQINRSVSIKPNIFEQNEQKYVILISPRGFTRLIRDKQPMSFSNFISFACKHNKGTGRQIELLLVGNGYTYEYFLTLFSHIPIGRDTTKDSI